MDSNLFDQTEIHNDSDFVFLGYLCFEDIVRPNVTDSINLLTKHAGVRVRMVTGDSVKTAISVA